MGILAKVGGRRGGEGGGGVLGGSWVDGGRGSTARGQGVLGGWGGWESPTHPTSLKGCEEEIMAAEGLGRGVAGGGVAGSGKWRGEGGGSDGRRAPLPGELLL